jgi:dihydropteroate synthase
MEWVWKCRDRVMASPGAPFVMGVLNVTPDSFSDGGRFDTPRQAIEAGLRLLEEGADLLDVGGESTRPGAEAVTEAEETLRAGAVIVNDVSALAADPGMAAVARTWGAGVVAMHMRGTPRTMQDAPRYADVVGEVGAYLAGRRAALEAAGLDADRLAVDPGIGFGKTVEHNLQLLAHLGTFAAAGRPVVVGVSRKSFIGRLTGRDTGERLAGSLATAAFCALNGAAVLRVHDVAATVDAVRMLRALQEAGRSRGGVTP